MPVYCARLQSFVFSTAILATRMECTANEFSPLFSVACLSDCLLHCLQFLWLQGTFQYFCSALNIFFCFQGSIAYVRALEKAGLVNAEESSNIQKGLNQVQFALSHNLCVTITLNTLSGCINLFIHFFFAHYMVNILRQLQWI